MSPYPFSSILEFLLNLQMKFFIYRGHLVVLGMILLLIILAVLNV